MFAKQISDYDIVSIKYLTPKDPYNIITCGKESIRLWKIKNKHISGSSIVLNEHARDTTFNDFVIFDYNTVYGYSDLVAE